MAELLHFMVALESAGPCAVCGVEVVLPGNLLRAKRENKGNFYCPNGHILSFHEGEVDRLRKKLADAERAKVASEQLAAIARTQRDQAEAQARTLKGALTKAKKRISGGVCPCCNRTFTALGRHMKTKHPDFGGENE